MELYILNRTYERIHVVDTFESLIWTERWQAYGEFELEMQSNRYSRSLFAPDVLLAMSESDRVMVVDTVEDINDPEENLLKVSGVSIEAPILQSRVVSEAPNATGTWYVTSSPIGIPRMLFDHIYASPYWNVYDAIPLLSQRFINPDYFAEEEGITDTLDWVQERPDTLYNEIQRACKPYNLGFRIVRDPVNPQLYFEVYTGVDRTTKRPNQDVDPIVYDYSLDNVQNTRQLDTKRGYKNTAFVYTDDGFYKFVVRPDPGLDITSFGYLEGLERHIIPVPVTIPADWTGGTEEYLDRVGKNVLSQQQYKGVTIFEGELNENAKYKYNVDYTLGDILELRNRDGVVSYKHVTEQIFVSDAEGERSYPAVSVGKFNQPIGWKMYNKAQDGKYVWEDFDDSNEVWEDM